MKYKPGAVVIPSKFPVIATDRFDQFGNQIFVNTGTAHDCIIWNGALYVATMAATLRDDALRAAAPETTKALADCLRFLADLNGCDWIKGDDAGSVDMRQRAKGLQKLAFAAIAKAKGEA